MALGKAIKFIRVRGRIVPIRVNKDKARRTRGALQTGAGLALGIFGGRQVGKKVLKAAIRQDRAARVMKIARQAEKSAKSKFWNKN